MPVIPHLPANGTEEPGRLPAEDGGWLMHASLRLNGGLLVLNDDIPEFHEGRSSAPHPSRPAPVTIRPEMADVDAARPRPRGLA